MDILNALDQLDEQDKKKKAAANKKTPEQSLAEATRRNARRPSQTPRPRSQPPTRAPSRNGATTPPPSGPSRSPTHLSPNTSPRVGRSIGIIDQPPRSQSTGADSRRISFADAPRAAPTRYQVKIATKYDSLGSGFPFDGQKLVKYDVTAKEWNHFSNEVVIACDAHHYNAITWPLARSKVIRKVRNDLKYGQGPKPGEISTIFKRWNKVFRRQGFQAWMELPSDETAEELGRSTAGMNKDDQKQAQKEAKRFRIVISPLDNKGGSIYSKSSIRGSVSGEGNFVKRAGTIISNITNSSHSVKEGDEEKQDDVKTEAAKAEASTTNGEATNGEASGVEAAGKENAKEEEED